MLNEKFIRSFIYCIIAVITLAIASQITIPLPQIPITAQSLVVLLIGYALKSRLAAIAIVLYLLVGIIGIPVFADATFGLEKLLGNSGGFLYGFVFGAYVVGRLTELGWAETFPKSLIATTIGTAIILSIGVTHLSYHIGFEKAVQYGLRPFIAGAIVKIILGAFIMWMLETRFKRYF